MKEDFNESNVKIICRIRPPKSFESKKDCKKDHYTSVRNKSLNNSANSSPFSNYFPYIQDRLLHQEGTFNQASSILLQRKEIEVPVKISLI